MVYKSRTVAWAHMHRDHEQRSCWLHGTMDGRTPLRAYPCSSAFKPFSIKTCFASPIFCGEATGFVLFCFFPTPQCVRLETSISYQRQKLLHKFGTWILCEWGRPGFFVVSFFIFPSVNTDCRSRSTEQKEKQPRSSSTIELECKEDRALAVTASLAKVKKTTTQ